MRKKTQEFKIYGNIKSRLWWLPLTVIAWGLVFTSPLKANEMVSKGKHDILLVSGSYLNRDSISEKQIIARQRIEHILPLTIDSVGIPAHTNKPGTGDNSPYMLRVAECSKEHQPPPEENYPPPTSTPPPQPEKDKKPGYKTDLFRASTD